jgi:hypothetical protein
MFRQDGRTAWIHKQELYTAFSWEIYEKSDRSENGIWLRICGSSAVRQCTAVVWQVGTNMSWGWRFDKKRYYSDTSANEDNSFRNHIR